MEPRAPLHSNPLAAYQIRDPIGSGSFGTVQEGLYTATESPVAIKRAHKDRKKEVLQEIDMLKRLSELPYIAGLREEFPEEAMFVAQMAPGQDLLKLLQESLLTFDQWLALTYQLLDFLTKLHKTNHFHGDLKPDNLMFDTASNSLTVIDVGGAGRVGDPFQICQAPPFRAPEVILKGSVDTGMDIWSSAILLFEALTAEHLFSIVCPSLERDMNIRDNQLLHMICDLIGMPNHDFLMQCQGSAAQFFQFENGSVTFTKPLRAIDQEKWTSIQTEYDKYFTSPEIFDSWQQQAKNDLSIQELMDKALTDMSEVYWKQEDMATRLKNCLKEDPVFPEEKIASITAILLQMLKYPAKRLPASKLIENPLFDQGMTHFDLLLPPGRHEVTIFNAQRQAMTYKTDRIARTCCFPNNNLQAHTFIAASLERNQVLEPRPIKIENGDLVALKKDPEGKLTVQVVKPSTATDEQKAMDVDETESPNKRGAQRKPPIKGFLPTKLFTSEPTAPPLSPKKRPLTGSHKDSLEKRRKNSLTRETIDD